jgi:ABC-type proline/glycine betaine transport system permease subunit
MRRNRLSKLRRRAATIAAVIGVPTGIALAWTQHPSYGTGGLIQTFGSVAVCVFAAYVIAGLIIVALEDE